MAASTIQNPASRTESKSGKKKKAAKTDAGAPTTPAETPTEVITSFGMTESGNGDGSYESPYIKELYKNIRNVNKKISNASKVDTILAENPTMSLDDLVAARKINADQKAQILKKPQLQASLIQLEEQIAQYKKFDQEYKARSQAEKAEIEKMHMEQAAKELEKTVAAVKAEAETSYAKELQSNLLLVSQFLRLAAARRSEEADALLDENLALEGVLLSVYSGDETAVATMIKLINGDDENVCAVAGEKLQTTFAQVKSASIAHAPISLAPESVAEESYISPVVENREHPIQGDPALAHPSLTEPDAPATLSMSNGHGESGADVLPGISKNVGIDEDAANTATEPRLDTNADLSASQEWVDVKMPRDVAAVDLSVADTTPVETSLVATAGDTTPAGPPQTKSWADDQPDSPNADIPTTNDGFHEVHRPRGRDRDGQFRGRGRGGENGGYRNRGGFRGDSGYRGRGRGAARGGGVPRPRRSEES